MEENPLVLHTADIHLQEVGDARWKALEEILKAGDQEGIDIMVISGDLFDNKSKGDDLLDPLIEIFQRHSFEIVFILGNHDQDIVSTTGRYFGSNVYFIDDLRNPFDYNDELSIWGLPYDDSIPHFEIPQMLNGIKEKLDEKNTNILLYHGNFLDKAIKIQDYEEGRDGWKLYMPLKVDYFRDLNFNYILCGHNHNKSTIRQFKDEMYVCYPGSPCPIRRGEYGPRHINLIRIGEAPEKKKVNVPYHKKVEIRLDPFDDINPIERIESEFNEIDPLARVEYTISGYIDKNILDLNQNELKQEVDKIIEENEITLLKGRNIYKVRDFSHIMEYEIVQRLLKRLGDISHWELPSEDLDPPNSKDKKEMEKTAIKAMLEVIGD